MGVKGTLSFTQVNDALLSKVVATFHISTPEEQKHPFPHLPAHDNFSPPFHFQSTCSSSLALVVHLVVGGREGGRTKRLTSREEKEKQEGWEKIK